MKDTQKQILIAVTGMREIPFVAAGLTLEESGFLLTEDAVTRLSEALETAQAESSQVVSLGDQITALQQSLQEATTARETAEAALVIANQTIEANATRILQLETDEDGDGLTQTSRNTDNNGKNKVPFHASAENPINKMADGLMGAPKPASAE